MSEAASVPFSETKAPESPERLHRGALGLVDIAASTMANIGPAYRVFFGFGLNFLANLALPFYYRKYRPQEFNVLKHLVLPVLGMIAIAIPVYYLGKPPQPQPYDWFPYAAFGVVVVSVIYAFVLNRSDPTLGDRVGSIGADE
jgi:hypothetical protein